jgi:hypothetical protein
MVLIQFHSTSIFKTYSYFLMTHLFFLFISNNKFQILSLRNQKFLTGHGTNCNNLNKHETDNFFRCTCGPNCPSAKSLFKKVLGFGLWIFLYILYVVLWQEIICYCLIFRPGKSIKFLTQKPNYICYETVSHKPGKPTARQMHSRPFKWALTNLPTNLHYTIWFIM